jgi:hypothetical protein
MVLRRLGWPVVGATAAALGGLLWAVKAGGLMTMGREPPHAFESALVLFPLASLGLYHRLPEPRPRSAVIGAGIAWIGVVAALGALAGLLFGPEGWVPTGDTVTVLTPFLTLSPLGAAISLLLVGLAVRRSGVLPRGWRLLPVVLAVGMYPGIGVSGALEHVAKRLFELPTLVVGCAWAGLGILMLRSSRRSPSPAGPSLAADNRD